MKKIPKDVCEVQSGFQVTKRIRQALGLKDTMPASLHGDFKVDGHDVRIYPGARMRPLVRASTTWGRAFKTSKHRIYIKVRGKWVPSGRVHQHCHGRYGRPGGKRW